MKKIIVLFFAIQLYAGYLYTDKSNTVSNQSSSNNSYSSVSTSNNASANGGSTNSTSVANSSINLSAIGGSGDSLQASEAVTKFVGRIEGLRDSRNNLAIESGLQIRDAVYDYLKKNQNLSSKDINKIISAINDLKEHQLIYNIFKVLSNNSNTNTQTVSQGLNYGFFGGNTKINVCSKVNKNWWIA